MEAATIKDNPDVSKTVKHLVKQSFSDFWNVSRRLGITYDKYVKQANAEADVDNSEALMYEVVQAVFNSPDPVKSLALLQAFNNGDVQLTE